MTAMTAQLKRGVSTQTLTVTDNIVFPDLASAMTIIGGAGAADPVLVHETIGPVTTMSVPITVSAATQALLATALDTLDAFLRGGTCTLEITFPGSSTATIWDVYGGQPTQPLYTLAVDVGHVAQFALELSVSPFARKAVVALYDGTGAGAVSTPCTLSLSGMTSTYKTPLTLTVDTTTANLHSCYIAVDPTSYSATITNLIKDAKDLTWSTGETDTSDTNARIDNAAKFKTNNVYSTAPIDTQGMPEGAYLLLARVKVVNASYAGYITTDYTDDVVTFTNTTWALVELGTCHIPVRKTRNSAAANLTVSVKSVDNTSTHEVWLDWVAFVPLDAGMWSWHHSTSSSVVTTLYRDPRTGVTYADNIADGQHDNGVSLLASGGALFIVSEPASGTGRTHSAKISLSYYPRYAYMR